MMDQMAQNIALQAIYTALTAEQQAIVRHVVFGTAATSTRSDVRQAAETAKHILLGEQDT